MENDTLRLFNLKLVNKIAAMSDDELWNFIVDNLKRLEVLTDERGYHPSCVFIYAYRSGGIEHCRKIFLRELDEYREGLFFEIAADFSYGDEKVRLEYYGRGGLLDHPDSCDVRTSEEVMPPVDDDSEAGYNKDYFYLLEPHHLEHIIKAMEKNFDKIEEEKREDIDKIKNMKDFCLKNSDYKVAYIYEGR